VAEKHHSDGFRPGRLLTGPEENAPLSDAQLLERFVSRRDHAAFATLVARHGPMVLAVCRRLLPSVHDAEDAFQATFLVLVRRAAHIRQRELLANWLYGVAHRVATRARTQAARRRTYGGQDIERVAAEAPGEWPDRDVQPVLHEEINRLAAKYRTPVVLCYLQGKTNEEAAQELGCPVGTVKGRLARARNLLRGRLTRRGLAVPAWLVAAALAPNAAPAAVSAMLGEATVQAAMRLAAGEATALVSARVADLTDGALRGMGPGHWKAVVAGLVALPLLALIPWLAFRPGGGDNTRAEKDSPVKPPGAEGKEEPKPAPQDDDRKKIQGTWKATSAQVDGKEVPGADKINQMTLWIFTGDKVIVKLGDQRAELAYKLDPSRKPRWIDYSPIINGRPDPKETVRGVYELDGDTLRICKLHPITRPGRPAEVASRPGSGTFLLILKRQR
jgi:RNA polymerase sigma factor (sigma-70 family)